MEIKDPKFLLILLKSSLLYINSVIHVSADKLHIGQNKFINTEELTQLLIIFIHIHVKSEFKNDFKNMCIFSY